MTNKIILIQSQYSYLEDFYYKQFFKFYPVDKLIEKVVKELFNNNFDLLNTFNIYNNFDFKRYESYIQVILNKIIFLQENT